MNDKIRPGIVEQVRTTRLRWCNGALEQAWDIYEEVDGKGAIREEWRAIPVVKDEE